MFYLTTHSTHFTYGYMASDIWLRTILIVRKETRCPHIGYSYRLTARVLLYAPSHRQASLNKAFSSFIHSDHRLLGKTHNQLPSMPVSIIVQTITFKTAKVHHYIRSNSVLQMPQHHVLYVTERSEFTWSMERDVAQR